MVDIAKLLKCSEHKIVYWMMKYHIARRSRSEASYVQQNPNGDPFNIQTSLSPEEQKIFWLALGIYWGEGNKVSPHVVKVTNTDPDLLRIFQSFLTKICHISPEKISYSIVAFHDNNSTVVRSYWANQLQISPEKFGKIVQIPTQGRGTYKKKSMYGVCMISVSNIKLKAWILKQLQNLKNAWVV